jgi:hypothetical protein
MQGTSREMMTLTITPTLLVLEAGARAKSTAPAGYKRIEMANQSRCDHQLHDAFCPTVVALARRTHAQRYRDTLAVINSVSHCVSVICTG